ncbi:MAG: hypothetical protein LC751_15225 [Actinobacteria bacterium]|nr:hypothetical protein [Actinomycetota bacterium]
MTGDPARVFIVAPTPFARAGLRSLLEEVGAGADVIVVGEASSLDEPEPALLEADVVIVAGDETLEETARTVAEEGTQAMLVLSEDDRSVSVLRALAPGGWGVVSPDAPLEELSAAIVAVARGLVVLSRTLTWAALRPLARARGSDSSLCSCQILVG